MHRSVQLLDLHRSRLLGSLQTINEKKGKKTCISEYYLPEGMGAAIPGGFRKALAAVRWTLLRPCRAELQPHPECLSCSGCRHQYTTGTRGRPGLFSAIPPDPARRGGNPHLSFICPGIHIMKLTGETVF